MLTAFIRAFRTPDLRKKLLFTLGMITLFRFGSTLPAPGIDQKNVSICAAAVAENACAVTRTATLISPVPSTLISSPLRAAPLATRFSGVTSPPSGNSSASRPVFTTW